MSKYIHTLRFPKHSYLILEGRHDPITKEKFKYGDKVVICAKCKSVFSLLVWQTILDERHCLQKCTIKDTEIISSEKTNIQSLKFKKDNLTVYNKIQRWFNSTKLYQEYIFPFIDNFFVKYTWKTAKYIGGFIIKLIKLIAIRIRDILQ